MKLAHFAHVWGKPGMTPHADTNSCGENLNYVTSSGLIMVFAWNTISLPMKAGCQRPVFIRLVRELGPKTCALVPWVMLCRYIIPCVLPKKSQ